MHDVVDTKEANKLLTHLLRLLLEPPEDEGLVCQFLFL